MYKVYQYENAIFAPRRVSASRRGKKADPMQKEKVKETIMDTRMNQS